MGDFGAANFDLEMNLDLGEVRRAEELVNQNFQRVLEGQEQNWTIPEEFGFEKNVLAADANIFNQQFTFTRDFSNQLESARMSLSRSKFQ